ncbi:hypothetical protein ACUNV4_06350 [Granulosicoccus sp. 3-233]|uniref:hypothetical protein n=1 Tax=Granulosicoccus sp. 3-233 TaxID=3417969 RepID=UPI003D333E9C
MIHYRIFGGIVGLLTLVSHVQADQRVLFRFDNTGVQVHRVMQLEEQTDFSSSGVARSMKGMPEQMIVMRWLDGDGVELAVNEVADPRVAHSPNHTNAFVQSRHGLESGGWVANGPDAAESVSVEMPEKSALGLPAETWVLPLNVE